MRALFQTLLVGICTFCVLFFVCLFIEETFHPFGARVGSDDWIVMVSGAVAFFIMITSAIGRSQEKEAIVSEEASVAVPKPKNLSHLKKRKENLEEELHHEQQISELEQKLLAERRLREKYKKLALGED